MHHNTSLPRPRRQRAGAAEAAPKGGPPEQIGEGSYEATRDYQKNIADYLKDADVAADAKAAKPKTEQEAVDMEKAEEEGKSHSKGER